jgi:two-component system chemotaxis response regulator CheV
MTSSPYDLFEDEEELDIVKLVSTDANDSNQYLLFEGSDGQYYAKNVSKID